MGNLRQGDGFIYRERSYFVCDVVFDRFNGEYISVCFCLHTGKYVCYPHSQYGNREVKLCTF